MVAPEILACAEGLFTSQGFLNQICHSVSTKRTWRVIVVGASAGGVKALCARVKALPMLIASIRLRWSSGVLVVNHRNIPAPTAMTSVAKSEVNCDMSENTD
jgi:chemotaxis response regulator CheB